MMKNLNRKVAGMLAAVLMLIGCRGQGQPSQEVYTVLAPEAFKAMMTSDTSILLLDVRRPDEFEAGTIGRAVNVNVLEEESFTASMADRDREQPVMLFCRSGRRSQRAARILEDMGFKSIIDLEGGYLAWEESQEE